jgi:hypothetical protein
MPTTVNVPGRGTLTFDDNVSDAEIQQIVQKEFPVNGEDVVRSIAEDPSYAQRMSRDDFMEMRRYKDDNPIAFSTKLAEAFGGIGELVSNAFTTAPKFDPQAGPIEKGVSLVANIGQGAMVGAGDFANMFLGMVEGYSNDNNSYTRYRLSNDLKDTPENKAAYDQIIDKDFENFKALQTWQQTRKDILGQSSMPAMAETISLVAQPPLPGAALLEAAGVGERIGMMGARAAQMGGKGIQAVGEATSAVAKVPQQVAGAAAQALTGSEKVGGMVEKAVATGSTGLAAGQLGGFAIPGLSTAATSIAGAKAIGKGLEVAGEVTQKLAEHAGKKAGRLGVYESLANDLSASTAARAIGRIGSVAGADVVAPYVAAAARGAVEGAAIGGALGFITDGEEGAAGGMGAGLALGGAGGLAGRGYAQGSGMLRNNKIQNDAVRGIASLEPESRANASRLFDQFIKDGNHEAVAEMVDAKNWLSSDVYFSFINNEQAKAMPAAKGTSFEGITVFPSAVTGGKPAIYINVDTVKPGTGFHESFHGAMRTALGETFGKKFTDVIDQTFTPEQKTQFAEDYIKRGGTEEGKQKLRDYLAEKQNLPEEIGAEYFRDFLQRRENRDYLLRGQRNTDGSLIAAAKGAIDYTLSKLGIDYDATGTGYKGMDALASELIKARTDINKSIAQNGKPLAPVPLDKMPTPKLADWAKQHGQSDVLLKDPTTGDVVGVKTEEQVNIGREAAYARAAEEIANVPRGTNAPNDAELAIYQKHLTPEQFAKLTFASEAIKSGNVLNADHFPASAKKGETSVYASRGMTNLDFVPYKIRTTKKNVIVVDYVDLTQLKARFDDMMSRSKISEQWGGDKDAAWQDVMAYTKNLSLGEGAAKPSAQLFGPIKRDIINKIYGFVPTKAQISEGAIKNISSLGTNIAAESGTGKGQIGKPAYEGSKDTRVVSTMRLDRLGRVADTGRQFSFNENGTYGLSQVNFKPAENLGSAKVNNSDEGFRIITKGNKHSLYAPTGERIGIYDTPDKAEAKANSIEKASLNKDWGMNIDTYNSLKESAPKYNFLPAEQQPENVSQVGRLTTGQKNSIQELSSYYNSVTPNRIPVLERDAVESLATRLINKGVPVAEAQKLSADTFNRIKGHVEESAQVISGLGASDLARMAGTGRPTAETRKEVNPVWLTSAFEAFRNDNDLAMMKAQQVATQLNKKQQAEAMSGKLVKDAVASSKRASTIEQGTGFLIGETNADKKAFGSSLREDKDSVPRVYASVIEGQKFGSQGNYNVFFEWNKETPMVVTSHHHYGVGNGLTDIHASANVGDKNARSFGNVTNEKYTTLPSGKKILDTHLLVGNAGIPSIRAHQLMVSIPESAIHDVKKFAKNGDMSAIADTLESVAYGQLVGSNSQGKTQAFTSSEGVAPKVAIQRNRTEAYVLNPDLANVKSVTIVSNKPEEIRILRNNLKKAFDNNGIELPEIKVVSAESGPSANPGRAEITKNYLRLTGEVAFMPAEKLPNGQAWSADNNYRVIQKEGGKYRVYAPTGAMIGVADTLDKSKKLIEKRSR